MIECKNFSKRYKSKLVIDKTDLTIRDCKISFIMGQNGSGKTTFIKCLMDMEEYEGNFVFGGKNINEIRSDCLVLWDDCPFYSNLSGLDNLIIFGERKKSSKEVLNMASNYMELELLKSKVKSYSYGQKKKLALVLMYILAPKYLIMDEISNGLDYDAIRKLKTTLQNLSNSMTIILTGHQFDFYNELVDDVFIFQDKKIILYEQNVRENGVKLEDIYDEKMY